MIPAPALDVTGCIAATDESGALFIAYRSDDPASAIMTWYSYIPDYWRTGETVIFDTATDCSGRVFAVNLRRPVVH